MGSSTDPQASPNRLRFGARPRRPTGCTATQAATPDGNAAGSPKSAAALLVVAATALLFLWPAILNGYPLLFSDTGGFLEQALMPDMGWDKPWVYGPFLTPFHLRLTLWAAAGMQALLLSAALWLAQAALRPPSLLRHTLLCTVVAALTAAPWFASLLMPDILAPITALGLFILAQSLGNPRLSSRTLGAVALLTTVAIASHLAHLILAAACIATLGLLNWRTIPRTAAPLAAAVAVLLASNWFGNHLVAISPYGSDFALARLVADGPARDTIQESCPASGWHLCAWAGHLPANSDDFLWDPQGPVWSNGSGPIRLAPEAAAIVRATILAHPIPVLAAAIANTARQLVRTGLGDTLGPDYLQDAVLPRIRSYFPPAEAARLLASRQYRGQLRDQASPLVPFQAATLIAALLATAAIAVLGWRRDRPTATLATLTLAALLANAFSTGALSGPHDRYQARIAWLLVVPPILLSLNGATARRSVAALDAVRKLPASAPPPPAAGGSCAG